MNAGESVPNAFLMREKRVDENSAKAALTSSVFGGKRGASVFFAVKPETLLRSRCPLFHTDWPAEAGAVKEGVGAAGPADKARDPKQPEFRLQTAYRGAQRVSHCQGATCCHPADRGTKKELKNPAFACTHTVKQPQENTASVPTEQIMGSPRVRGLLLHIISALYLVWDLKLTAPWLRAPPKENGNAQCTVTAHLVRIEKKKTSKSCRNE